MGDKHLSTILETKSKEEIKSSVEDLVPIPSESEGISDDTCDVPFCDNSPSLDVLNNHSDIFSYFNNECTRVMTFLLRTSITLKHHLLILSSDDFSPVNNFEEKSVTFSNPLFDSNDDFISSDDESLSDKDIPKDNVYSNPLFEFDDEYISSNVNPLFDKVLEHIESNDFYDSNLDESDLLFTPLFDANKGECFGSGSNDKINVLDCEDGYYDSEGDILYLESLFNYDLVHHDPSIPAMSVYSILEGFTDEPPLEENDDLFDLESKNDEWKKILYDAPIDNLMTGDKIFDPEIWSEDTIFDPGISAFHFSHRSGTFISFNVYPHILNEIPMENFSSTRFTPNIMMIWDLEASRARGFVHRPLELQSFAYENLISNILLI
nr:hypothetical protein [Tanacetum cinerariifolium]